VIKADTPDTIDTPDAINTLDTPGIPDTSGAPILLGDNAGEFASRVGTRFRAGPEAPRSLFSTRSEEIAVRKVATK
jgi:hypothetical protein